MCITTSTIILTLLLGHQTTGLNCITRTVSASSRMQCASNPSANQSLLSTDTATFPRAPPTRAKQCHPLLLQQKSNNCSKLSPRSPLSASIRERAGSNAPCWATYLTKSSCTLRCRSRPNYRCHNLKKEKTRPKTKDARLQLKKEKAVAKTCRQLCTTLTRQRQL